MRTLRYGIGDGPGTRETVPEMPLAGKDGSGGRCGVSGGRPKDGEKNDSNRIIIRGGTNTNYTLARLERDGHPLAEKVKAGGSGYLPITYQGDAFRGIPMIGNAPRRAAIGGAALNGSHRAASTSPASMSAKGTAPPVEVSRWLILQGCLNPCGMISRTLVLSVHTQGWVQPMAYPSGFEYVASPAVHNS